MGYKSVLTTNFKLSSFSVFKQVSSQIVYGGISSHSCFAHVRTMSAGFSSHIRFSNAHQFIPHYFAPYSVFNLSILITVAFDFLNYIQCPTLEPYINTSRKISVHVTTFTSVGIFAS